MVKNHHLSAKATKMDTWSIQMQFSEASMNNAVEAAENFIKQFSAEEPSVSAMLLRELLMAIYRHASTSSVGKMIEMQLIPTENDILEMVFKLKNYDFTEFLLTKGDSTMLGLSEREYLLIHSLSERILISDERDTLVAEVSLPQGKIS